MAPARRPIYELAGPLQEPFDSFKQSNGDSSRSEDQTQTQTMALNNSGVMVGSANQQQTQSQVRDATPTKSPQTTTPAGIPRMPSAGSGDMVISQGGQTLVMPNGRKDKDTKKPAPAAPVTIVPAATSAPIYTPPSGGTAAGGGGGGGGGGGELTPMAMPSPPTDGAPPAETKTKLGRGAMIGIAVCVVLLLSVSSIGAYFYMQKKKVGAGNGTGNGNGSNGSGGNAGNMSRALAGLQSSRG